MAAQTREFPSPATLAFCGDAGRKIQWWLTPFCPPFRLSLRDHRILGADVKRSICLVAIAALTASGNALSVGEIADVTVIDRDNGARLTPHYYHGEYWAAGSPGRRYAIEIRNHRGERVLAVTSVDGVNVISGKTASWTQSGYVLNPWEHYEINGWRKSDAEVAAFTFTASPNSYAARTGRQANIGVIGVALFRERQPQPVYAPPPSQSEIDPPLEARSEREPRSPQTSGPGPTSDAPSASSRDRATEDLRAPLPAAPRAEVTTPKLGTGHGAREDSFVVHVEFERLQAQPNEIIRIRYESLDNLVAMGIIRRWHPVATVLDPFPAAPESEYVPDPPGGS
jgi:hypothetical protein